MITIIIIIKTNRLLFVYIWVKMHLSIRNMNHLAYFLSENQVFFVSFFLYSTLTVGHKKQRLRQYEQRIL